MIQKKIMLHSEKDAVDFVNTITKYSCDIDMLRGRYVIDAKSILGVLGLGVGNIMILHILCDEADALLEEIKDYLVE